MLKLGDAALLLVQFRPVTELLVSCPFHLDEGERLFLLSM